jgi:hypothetical protein
MEPRGKNKWIFVLLSSQLVVLLHQPMHAIVDTAGMWELMKASIDRSCAVRCNTSFHAFQAFQARHEDAMCLANQDL